MAKDPQQSSGENILATDFDWFGVATGGTAYAVSMDGVGTAYNAGRLLAFQTGSASVGTATLNINSIGVKNIKVFGQGGLRNLTGTELGVNQVVVVTYDATNDCFVMISQGVGVDVGAGAHLFQSADTQRTETGTVYTKHKEITVYRSGSYRVSFTLSFGGAGTNAYGRIYINGVAVGTERSADSGGATFTEDVSGLKPGDAIQIYIKQTDADQARVSNFRIYVHSYDGSTVTYDA